jgi:hypothetical protein
VPTTPETGWRPLRETPQICCPPRHGAAISVPRRIRSLHEDLQAAHPFSLSLPPLSLPVTPAISWVTPRLCSGARSYSTIVRQQVTEDGLLPHAEAKGSKQSTSRTRQRSRPQQERQQDCQRANTALDRHVLLARLSYIRFHLQSSLTGSHG